MSTLGKSVRGIQRQVALATQLLFFVLVAASLPTATVHAQPTNPPYLAQLPSVARLKAEIRGKDSIDTSARQIAALQHLMAVINTFAGPRFSRNDFTPDEERIKGRYFNAWQVYLYKANEPRPQDIPRWNELRTFYENDPGFRDEVLKHFLAPEISAAYYRTIGTAVTSAPKAAQPTGAVNPPLPSAEKASSSSVSESDLYFAKGASMEKFKEYDAAIEAYQKSISLSPNSRNAALSHKQIGMIYNDKERYQEAETHLRESLRIDPAQHIVAKELGFAYYMRGMYGGAVTTLQYAIRVKPDYVAAYYLLGMSYLRMREKEKALRVYDELLKLNKKEADDLHEQIVKWK